MERAKASKSACAAGDITQVDDDLSREQSQCQCGNCQEVTTQPPRQPAFDESKQCAHARTRQQYKQNIKPMQQRGRIRPKPKTRRKSKIEKAGNSQGKIQPKGQDDKDAGNAQNILTL